MRAFFFAFLIFFAILDNMQASVAAGSDGLINILIRAAIPGLRLFDYYSLIYKNQRDMQIYLHNSYIFCTFAVEKNNKYE